MEFPQNEHALIYAMLRQWIIQSRALGDIQIVKETKTHAYGIQDHFMILEIFAHFVTCVKPANLQKRSPHVVPVPLRALSKTQVETLWLVNTQGTTLNTS